MIRYFLLSLIAATLGTAAQAGLGVNSLFGDNAVLQRGVVLPVWGEAGEGENVSVEFAGQRVATTAHNGRWKVLLKPMPAGGPFTMTVKGSTTVVLNNLLVGDVWVASGQSNMERQLGGRGGQQPIDNADQEIAAAKYPQIREYYVPEVLSLTTKTDVQSKWAVCSPQTVKDFTAVGYFFSRDVYKATGVPIGLIFSAWGGTTAEAWTSSASLKTMPDFRPAAEAVDAAAKDQKKDENGPAPLSEWYAKNDLGSKPGQEWSAVTLDAADWTTTNLPLALPDSFDGVMWFRKEINLPAAWAGQPAVLNLGPIDDMDTTWINGVQVGHMEEYAPPRRYPVAAGVLKAGANVIAVRVLDTGGVGGLMGGPDAYRLELAGPEAGKIGAVEPVTLAEGWVSKVGVELRNATGIPGQITNLTSNPNTPTVLYNGMIAPLVSFPIKGVVWYQGEANNDRATQYQTLFPLLISDWRKNWSESSGIKADFPFLFVQIAPWSGMSPEIREAQFLTLRKSPNTAMAVTADVGDASDIHPSHKGPVGARLALAARALAYGERLEYSGPLFQGAKFEGARATVNFTHSGSGLMAKGGPLRGFTIAGADGKFMPAHAQILGASVVVSSDVVPHPTSVRYGWANVPDVNLFNKEGLPASPFRSDSGP